jgi:D-alanine-D-alanine ligase
MFDHLDPGRYVGRAVNLLPGSRAQVLAPGAAPSPAAWRAAPVVPLLDAFRRLATWGADVALLALHGAGGEDGVMQGFLQTLGIPHTHSGVAGSAVSMDKELSKLVYHARGIATPRHVMVHAGENPVALVTRGRLGWPVVVKPPCLGSSFAVSIVRTAAALRAACTRLLRIDRRVMVEQYIRGREFTCAVLQRRHGGPSEPLPVTEIVPRAGVFFDYKSKYSRGGSNELTPAPVAARIARAIQRAAAQCHDALQCDGVSRTDFMLDAAGSLFALETNAIPGMTGMSLLPQAAEKAGISYPALLDIMIEHALSRTGRKGNQPVTGDK